MSESTENPMAYISKRWESLYEVLCKRDSVFDQMTNFFTLCAAIGHLNGEVKAPVDKKGIFRWSNLNSETEVSILTAMAWDARERDLSVLVDKKRIMDIASDYAESGMQYLYDNFFEDYMQDGQLLRPEKLDIEFNLAQIVEGLRQKQSIFQ